MYSKSRATALPWSCFKTCRRSRDDRTLKSDQEQNPGRRSHLTLFSTLCECTAVVSSTGTFRSAFSGRFLLLNLNSEESQCMSAQRVSQDRTCCYARTLSQLRGCKNLLVVIRLLSAPLSILTSDLIDSGLFVDIQYVRYRR